MKRDYKMPETSSRKNMNGRPAMAEEIEMKRLFAKNVDKNINQYIGRPNI
jgi:hypothetical protein